MNQGVLSGDANVLHPPPYRRGLIDGAPAGQLEAAFGDAQTRRGDKDRGPLKHGDLRRGRGLGRIVHAGFRQILGKCCVFSTGTIPMIKSLVVAAALSIGLAGYAFAQNTITGAPAGTAPETPVAWDPPPDPWGNPHGVALKPDAAPGKHEQGKS